MKHPVYVLSKCGQVTLAEGRVNMNVRRDTRSSSFLLSYSHEMMITIMITEEEEEEEKIHNFQMEIYPDFTYVPDLVL